MTDTTGAGDCFNAGVIAGLLDGLDLPSAVALGCAVGAAPPVRRAAPRAARTWPRRATLAQHVTVREVIPAPPAPPHT